MNIKKVISSVMALTLVGTSLASITASAEVQEKYTAKLQCTIGNVQVWDDSVVTPIVGDGDYSIELKVSAPTQAVEESGVIFIDTDINPYDFLDEDFKSEDNVEIAKATGIELTVDSVEVDGKTIEYKGPSVGAYKNEKDNLRLNIYNVWGNDVRDIDFNFDLTESVKINFSVNGLDDAIKKAKGESEVTENPTVGDSDGKTNTIGDSGKDTGKTNSTTKTTTTTAKASSPDTGDAGVGSVLVALSLASISAFALKKKD